MALLSMIDVHKHFGGVRALRGANLQVDSGEVHGLLGPNGSGKSTLNKVLSGTVNPDRADISIGDSAVTITKPQDAHRYGVASVYQQLSLVPEMSIRDNVLLGTEFTKGGLVSRKKSQEFAELALDGFWRYLDGSATLGTGASDLSPGSQQLVEIAKAVARKPKLLVLDEATASLRRDQVEFVFSLVRDLVGGGVSVIFVSHRLEEIVELCNRATILRNGQTVATVDIDSTPKQELVNLMVGTQLVTQESRSSGGARIDATPYLQVKNLSGGLLDGVSLEAHRGEIIGLGGLQGQGQSDLLHALFGDGTIVGGEILIDGSPSMPGNPRRAIDAGLALIPGDRQEQGLFMPRPILENLSIVSLRNRLTGGLFLSSKREKAAVGTQVSRLSIKIGDLMDPVSTLSGGNQQKVVLGKWLLGEPRIVLLDDPTKGVDVGAKAEIYALIRDLTAEGLTVVLNSSDDQELSELCDRVFVLYEGRIVTTLEGDDITPDSLVAAALHVGDGGSAEAQEGVER